MIVLFFIYFWVITQSYELLNLLYYCLWKKTLLFGEKVYDEIKKKSSLSEVTRCNLWCLIMPVKVIVM